MFWELFYDLLHDKIRMPVYNANGRKRIFDPNLSWNSNRASGLVLLKFINFMIKGLPSRRQRPCIKMQAEISENLKSKHKIGIIKKAQQSKHESRTLFIALYL